MNYVRVKISGLNLIRIVDKLVENNVLVERIILKKSHIKFSIKESDLKTLNKICKTEHKFYTILYKNGLKQIFFRLPYMFSTFVAIFICVAYFYITSLYINDVNLFCESNLSYNLSEVKNLLQTNGVISGAYIKNNKVLDIRNLILLNVDSVEDCVVKYNGRNLNIVIYPATLKNEISDANIYALYDGVVEDVTVYSGDLKVAVGDIVKKGDLLIESTGGASGEIIGKVYFSATKIYNENQQDIIYTGKTYIVNDYIIFNKVINFNRNQCNFGSYLVEKCSFFVNKNLFIPIVCNQTKYREIQIIDKTIPFNEVAEQIKIQTFNEAKRQISDESKITNVTYSIISEDSYTRVDCFIETQMSLF